MKLHFRYRHHEMFIQVYMLLMICMDLPLSVGLRTRVEDIVFFLGRSIKGMSHTITHTEVETWEEVICDNCGHGEGMHYTTPKKILVGIGSEYIAFGCIVLKNGGRQLEGQHSDNLRRCECTEFK